MLNVSLEGAKLHVRDRNSVSELLSEKKKKDLFIITTCFLESF